MGKIWLHAVLGVTAAVFVAGFLGIQTSKADMATRSIACISKGSELIAATATLDKLCEKVSEAAGLRVADVKKEDADFNLEVTIRSKFVAHYTLRGRKEGQIDSAVISDGDIDIVDGPLDSALLSHLPLIVSRSVNKF